MTKTTRTDIFGHLALFFFCALAFLTPIMPVLIPKSPAALFMACAILGVIFQSLHVRRLPMPDIEIGGILLGICTLGALGTNWSSHPDITLDKTISLLGFFTTVMFLSGTLRRDLSGDLARRICFWLVQGVSLGLAVYIFEYCAGFPIYRALTGDMDKLTDQIQNKSLYIFFATTLISLYYCWSRRDDGLKWLLHAAWQSIAVMMIIDVSMNITMQLVSKLVLLAFACMLFIPVKWSRSSILSAALVTIFTAPIFAIGLRNIDGIVTGSLPRTFRSRIEIWDLVSRRIMENPFFGWGLKSSPYLDNRGEISMIYLDTGDVMPIAHLHPHNGVLEIWYELGIPGVLLAAAMVLVLINRIARIQDTLLQKFALLLFSVCFIYTLPSFGLWQTWFMASLAGFAALFMVMSRALPQSGPRE